MEEASRASEMAVQAAVSADKQLAQAASLEQLHATQDRVQKLEFSVEQANTTALEAVRDYHAAHIAGMEAKAAHLVGKLIGGPLAQAEERVKGLQESHAKWTDEAKEKFHNLQQRLEEREQLLAKLGCAVGQLTQAKSMPADGSGGAEPAWYAVCCLPTLSQAELASRLALVEGSMGRMSRAIAALGDLKSGNAGGSAEDTPRKTASAAEKAARAAVASVLEGMRGREEELLRVSSSVVESSKQAIRAWTERDVEWRGGIESRLTAVSTQMERLRSAHAAAQPQHDALDLSSIAHMADVAALRLAIARSREEFKEISVQISNDLDKRLTAVESRFETWSSGLDRTVLLIRARLDSTTKSVVSTH